MSKNKPSKSASQTRSAKKAAVLDKKDKTAKGKLLIAVAIVAAMVIYGIYSLRTGGSDFTANSAESYQADAGTLSYPVNLFDDGKARFYTHTLQDGTKLRFFVLKSADGVIRAAFDACDVCWPADKGYAQQGDLMVCRNCGQRFSSVRINEVKGGCNPAPLDRSVEQERLIIRLDDLTIGKQYFGPKGGV